MLLIAYLLINDVQVFAENYHMKSNLYKVINARSLPL